MKGSELVRYLKKNGVRLARHGASHDEYSNPATGAVALIPRHQSQDIKKGTVEKILKDLGLK